MPSAGAKCFPSIPFTKLLIRADFTSLLLRSFFSLDHHSAQDPIDARLVARSFRFEPVHHLPVHPQRDSLLPRTIPSRLCPSLLIRQHPQCIIGRCPQPGNSPRSCARPLLLCFLTFGCHDVIVQPQPSSRCVPAGTTRPFHPRGTSWGTNQPSRRKNFPV
jgi:hypothetical protein